jgi:glycosyltransferase involved in cell wall biosynthesis
MQHYGSLDFCDPSGDMFLRILIVHNDYQMIGGEYIAVKNQAQLLEQYGHDVIFYGRSNEEIKNYSFREKMIFFPNALFSRRTYQEIDRLIASEKPDVAHVHNVFPLISPSVYQALKDANVPIVQTIHNFRFLCPNALFYTHEQICERCKHGNTLHAIRWKCYRQSYTLSALYALSIGWHRHRNTFQQIDRYIALTEFGARKLQEAGLACADKISVLGNFLPTPIPHPGSFHRRDPYVVYLGRLSPEKGVDVLVKAMRGITQLRLKIAGDGPEVDKLHRLVQQQGLSHIDFVGYVSGEQKWDLLRNAKALIFPSVWYEQFPITILESFAVGTPVIASNVGSLPHIVHDTQNGLLFESGQADNLNEKLNWLSEHPENVLTMGNQGRYMTETLYSAETHYNQLMTIYQQLKC